ncbi:conserved hypothetical protein [Ricinus communis]|uniref:F-box domain-containing protein n=1 Tax=Ricinus communis TaxID=3988 RepID=B9SFB0_RICCO|nr:conserved hypothetical protein [Ricinus communis]
MEEQSNNHFCQLFKQQSNKFKSLDRISALPDPLLSFLPLAKEAVKTSGLSRRWQHLWTHVPNLIFHHCKDNPTLLETD